MTTSATITFTAGNVAGIDLAQLGRKHVALTPDADGRMTGTADTGLLSLRRGELMDVESIMGHGFGLMQIGALNDAGRGQHYRLTGALEYETDGRVGYVLALMQESQEVDDAWNVAVAHELNGNKGSVLDFFKTHPHDKISEALSVRMFDRRDAAGGMAD